MKIYVIFIKILQKVGCVFFYFFSVVSFRFPNWTYFVITFSYVCVGITKPTIRSFLHSFDLVFFLCFLSCKHSHQTQYFRSKSLTKNLPNPEFCPFCRSGMTLANYFPYIYNLCYFCVIEIKLANKWPENYHFKRERDNNNKEERGEEIT